MQVRLDKHLEDIVDRLVLKTDIVHREQLVTHMESSTPREREGSREEGKRGRGRTGKITRRGRRRRRRHKILIRAFPAVISLSRANHTLPVGNTRLLDARYPYWLPVGGRATQTDPQTHTLWL